MKISNLLEKDFKLIEKKKIWFIIPACIFALAIVMMIIFGFTLGEPLNLGMDFQGGYTINVTLKTKLTDDTYEYYVKQVTDVIENLTDEDGNNYNVKVSGVQRQGEGSDASLYIKYKAPNGYDAAEMTEDVNPAIKTALQEVFKIVPVHTVSASGTAYTVTYTDFPLNASLYSGVETRIQSLAAQNGISATDFNLSEDNKTITFNVSETNAAFDSALTNAAMIDDYYSGQAEEGTSVSATISGELLTNAILAICLSIVLMLVYIAFRFEVSSGVSAVIALLHDILVMFSFMAIFHIEISSSFIAALITILGYSINNTIIVFDRIRENKKSIYHKTSTATFIANESIRETLVRSINTSITTLLTIGMVAIIGVSSIRIFALPIIAGLLAGTYSSIFISPSIWAMWKDRKLKAPKSEKENKGNKEAVVA